jgi:uncharacterized C2H2 Zn-finger protein
MSEYKCNICEQVFKTKQNLAKHQNKMFKCNFKTPYQCNKCLKYFRKSASLFKHTDNKICDRLDIIPINNTIKIEGVLYSYTGLCRWMKQELNSPKNMIIIEDIIPLLSILTPPYLCCIERMSSIEFAVLFIIRSPFTNELYSPIIKSQLYDIFIKIGRNKYNDIKTFMKI